MFVGVCTASTKIRAPHPLCRNVKDSPIRTKESLVYNPKTAKLIQKERMYWSRRWWRAALCERGEERTSVGCGGAQGGRIQNASRRWKGRWGKAWGKLFNNSRPKCIMVVDIYTTPMYEPMNWWWNKEFSCWELLWALFFRYKFVLWPCFWI